MTTPSTLPEAIALIERLREIIRKAGADSDWCYACECHPSHGHAETCEVVEPVEQQCNDCGETILGYHSCRGVPGGFPDTE